jgi:transposase
MNMISADTTIEAMRKQFEILRRMGPEARLKTAFELSDNLRSIVEAGVRGRNPSYDEQQIKQEVLRLMIGERLYREVFGDKNKIE